VTSPEGDAATVTTTTPAKVAVVLTAITGCTGEFVDGEQRKAALVS